MEVQFDPMRLIVHKKGIITQNLRDREIKTPTKWMISELKYLGKANE